MTRWHRLSFNALAAAVTLTGIAYFWMKDVLVNDDPLALVNHPLQPAMLTLHLLAGPLLLVVFGIVFNAHVASKVTKQTRLRASGLFSLATFATMALSGYLLQVTVSETVRSTLVWVHLGSGAVFATSYTVHAVAAFRVWRRVVALGRPVSV